MCYSAQAWQDYRKYKREIDAEIGIQEYVRLFWDWKSGARTIRLPKAMIDAFADAASGEEGKIRQWIEARKIEQAAKLEQALFAQKKRLHPWNRGVRNVTTSGIPDGVGARSRATGGALPQHQRRREVPSAASCCWTASYQSHYLLCSCFLPLRKVPSSVLRRSSNRLALAGATT